ncbi:MAG: hypothetical protein ACR2KG_06745 [Nocardioidaceae bacterium]
MTNNAAEAAGPRIEKFASSSGRILGYVIVVFFAVVAVYSVATGFVNDIPTVLICIAFAALAWVVLIRPEAAAHQNGLLLQNMVRDYYVPWNAISRCRVAQTMQIATADKVYHGLGVTKSARQGLKQERRQKRAMDSVSSSFGMGGRTATRGEGAFGSRRGGGFGVSMFGAKASPPAPEGSVNYAKQEHVGGDYFSYVEQKVDQLAHSSRADAGPPVVTWAAVPIGALLVAIAAAVIAIV